MRCRRGMHRTRLREADERQDGQARPGRPRYLTPFAGWTRDGPGQDGAGAGEGEAAREVREALGKGENVKAKVTVKATDAAGNVATAKRTITLVK